MSASSSTHKTGCCGGSSSGVMRAGNAGTSAKKNGGCSCGGACGGGGSCGCGGCQGDDFARPRFFAGQLLTEDDLDLLSSYVVEKNRLHNRSFYGEGVVCGLLVTCNPCGGGKVSVQPGYALDCCGNDIVVPCAQTLDVNAMVKRLRIERTGGVDCGDPCAEVKSKQDPKSSLKPAATSLSTGTAAADPTKAPDVPPLAPAEYCLYIRYCEQSTDPVSPYATDDPCGAQACEPTRVREGFTFELRCRDCDEKTPDNLFSRIGECIGNLVTTERTTRNARSSLLYAANLTPALGRINDPEASKILIGPDRVEAVAQARLRADALPESADSWTAVNLYDAADSAQTMASLIAAWSALRSNDRRSLDTGGDVATAVKNAQASLARLQKIVPQDRIAKLIDDPFDRDLVAATTERSVLWAQPDQAFKTIPAGERELLAGGIVYSAQVRSSLSQSLARIKANLIDRLKKRAFVADCTLLADLNAIVIPDDEPASFSNQASALEARNATTELVDALIRYVRECICTAINPPCPTCDDPGVLLACLRVEGCDVSSICNLERTFVLTPVAFRYWMPFLHSFGNLLERLCCPDNSCDPKVNQPRPGTIGRVTSPDPLPRAYVERNSALNLTDNFVGAGKLLDPAHLAAILPAQFSFSPDSATRVTSSTAAVLDVVSLRHGVPPGDVIRMLVSPPAAILPHGGGVGTIGPAPTMEEVGVLRKDIDVLKASLKTSEERNRRFEARLKKLEG
jgi:hypothetical protein